MSTPPSRSAATTAAALGAGLALLVALALQFVIPKLHVASVRVLLSPAIGVDEGSMHREALDGIDDRWIHATLIEIAESAPLIEGAARSIDVVARDFEVRGIARAPAAVVELRVTGADAAGAGGLATAVAISAATKLEESFPVYRAELLERPDTGTPLRPSPLRDGIAAVLVGAALGLGWRQLRQRRSAP